MKEIKPPKVIRRLDGIYRSKKKKAPIIIWTKPIDYYVKLDDRNWWGDEPKT